MHGAPAGCVTGRRKTRVWEERKGMLNFEEELKKFHPSMEVEETEDAIYNNNVSDITDILVEVLKEAEQGK